MFFRLKPPLGYVTTDLITTTSELSILQWEISPLKMKGALVLRMVMESKYLAFWRGNQTSYFCVKILCYTTLRVTYPPENRLYRLVGGFNPSENISQIGNLPGTRGENKKYLKPLPSRPLEKPQHFLRSVSPWLHSCNIHPLPWWLGSNSWPRSTSWIKKSLKNKQPKNKHHLINKQN